MASGYHHDKAYSIHTEKSQHNAPVKSQAVNILASIDRMASVAPTQLCCCGTKAATDTANPNGHGCVPIKFYLQRQAVGQIWPVGCLPTPDIGHRTGSSNPGTTAHQQDELGHPYLVKPQFLRL